MSSSDRVTYDHFNSTWRQHYFAYLHKFAILFWLAVLKSLSLYIAKSISLVPYLNQNILLGALVRSDMLLTSILKTAKEKKKKNIPLADWKGNLGEKSKEKMNPRSDIFWAAIWRIKGLIQRLGERTAAIEINSLLPLLELLSERFYVSKTANCHLRSAPAFKSTWIHICHWSSRSNYNEKLLEIPHSMAFGTKQQWVKGWQAL